MKYFKIDNLKYKRFDYSRKIIPESPGICEKCGIKYCNVDQKIQPLLAIQYCYSGNEIELMRNTNGNIRTINFYRSNILFTSLKIYYKGFTPEISLIHYFAKDSKCAEILSKEETLQVADRVNSIAVQVADRLNSIANGQHSWTLQHRLEAHGLSFVDIL